jgi:hypothetical protein
LVRERGFTNSIYPIDRNTQNTLRHSVAAILDEFLEDAACFI